MEKKITEIIIRMDDEEEKIAISVSGEPNDVATAIVCGLSDISRELSKRLTDDGRAVFASEIMEIAREIDPTACEEDEQ